jgi:pimeloyl-ACP methyl ester carboxylesterase
LSAVGRLDWRVRRGAFPREAVHSLDVASALSIEGLRNDQRQDGIGVALVARTFPPRPDMGERLMPRVLPVTALPRFANADRPVIELYDAFDAHSVPTAFGGVPLAVDYSTAFNAWARELPNDWVALMSMLRPPASIGPELVLLQPYDPAKVPVILIHGLASGPRTWIDLANDLLGDPRIGSRIQIWTCRYVTSLPLLANRLAIATLLTDALRTLDPEGDDFAAHNVVLIGHSMGGVIARLLVSSSEMQLWNAAFTRPPAELEAKPEDRASAEALFRFEPWRPATRTIWIAAPHLGTPSATSWRGRVARLLMAAPTGALHFLERLAVLEPEQIRESVRESYLGGGPLSVDTLSSSQAVSGANASLRVASTVSIHSIVGVLDASAPQPGDGYVPLASTLWSGEQSRLVIESGHEVHRQPEAILEIKRILLEHVGVTAPGDASAPP